MNNPVTKKNIPQQDSERSFRIVFPKKGRIKDEFETVAKAAGLSIQKQNPRHDFGTGIDKINKEANFEILLQRQRDAIDTLLAGAADLAVIGLDCFEDAAAKASAGNQNFDISIIEYFNFSACSLQIMSPDTPNSSGSPNSIVINKPSDLAGLRIATSYPAALTRWLQDNNVKNVQIITREGGVEDCPRLGLADVVCDIVDSGKTAIANGLQKSLTLFNSHAVLVKRGGSWDETHNIYAAQITERLEKADLEINGAHNNTPRTKPGIKSTPERAVA